MSAAISAILSMALSAFVEIDEVREETLPDGRLRVTFVTTGVHPKLASMKALLWSLIAPPIQIVDEVEVRELQSGPIAKRYEIVVTLRPYISRGGSPEPPEEEPMGIVGSIAGVLTGRNVRVVRR